MKNKSLQGKNIIWLGSSVTYGHANSGVSMAEYVEENEGCRCYKYAVSGTTLADFSSNSYVSRLKDIKEPEKCDLFICQLSTNDASQNKPLGVVTGSDDIDSLDTKTVCGAIEFIILYVRKKWNCRIAFYTNPPYHNDFYRKMVESLKEIAEKHEISILDLWNDKKLLSMDEKERSDFLKLNMADPIHPNGKGYKDWWTPVFTDFIKKMI